MFMTTIPRRVWLEIDLGKLISNYRKIRVAVAPAQVLAVLKANAYGLGMLPIAQVLSCLLYTSPSPRDRTRARMPSSA